MWLIQRHAAYRQKIQMQKMQMQTIETQKM